MVKSEVTVNLFRLLLHIGLFGGGGKGRGKDYIFTCEKNKKSFEHF